LYEVELEEMTDVQEARPLVEQEFKRYRSRWYGMLIVAQRETERKS